MAKWPWASAGAVGSPPTPPREQRLTYEIRAPDDQAALVTATQVVTGELAGRGLHLSSTPEIQLTRAEVTDAGGPAGAMMGP